MADPKLDDEPLEDIATRVFGPSKTPGAMPKRPRTTAGKARAAAAKRASEPRRFDEEILALFQLPAGALHVAGVQTGRVVLIADSQTIVNYAPGIATALDDVAQQHEPTRKLLESILKMGPFGALFAATLPMALQLGTNHGKVPVGMLGTKDPTELLNQAGITVMPMDVGSAEGNGQGAVSTG